MGMIRSFVAVPVRGLTDIDTIVQEIGKISGIKGVRSENIHLTLKFLGNIDEELDVKPIKDILQKVAGHHASFRVLFKGTGAFPKPAKMRVAWIGIDSPELEELAKDVIDSLPANAGEKLQSFRAHLTIGRVKFSDGIDRARRVLERYRDHDFGSINVNEFLLIKSTLTPQGPIYEILERFPLTTPAEG